MFSTPETSVHVRVGVRQVGSPPFPFPALSISIPPTSFPYQWEGRSDPVRGKFPGFPSTNTALITVSDCGLRLSVLGQNQSETKRVGLGLSLAGLMSCCETRSCHARRRNDLEGHRNFSTTIYSFSILCLYTSLLWRSAVAFS